MCQTRVRDNGFTLIELLVVIIIIGLLASIAIPVFLSQRQRSRDAATKADVSTLGKEIATYYVDSSGPLAVDFTSVPGSVVIRDTAGYQSEVNVTKGTAAPSAGATKNLHDRDDWCVALSDNDGRVREFKFSADHGLQTGVC